MSQRSDHGRGLVSESDPNYEKNANRNERRGVDASRAAKGRATVDEPTLGLVSEIRAKYKIEVLFGPQRTILGPNLCGVQVWESGKKLHGGGDELAFWCLSNDGMNLGCGNIITGDSIKGGMALCPSCGKMINARMLTTMKAGRMTSKDLAKNLEKMFHTLNSNADIYLKYDQTDVRYLTVLKMKGQREARRLRGLHIYPLKNILKETAGGANIGDRIFSFLTA